MLGGKIKAFPQPKNYSFNQYILTPHEIRNILQAKKWERIVAFQTRNPLHRAHEYAIVYALEDLCKKGIDCGAVLNPLVGQTKSDDVPANIRMQTYEVLINGKLLGKGDLDDIFWSNQPFSFYDRVLLIALDMKMFYAGPKEAIMHAIYRQNCGFTDIIINRKHADAPYFDGTPVWGDFDAQKKIATVHGELLIKPYCTGYVAYFDEIKRVGLAEFYKQKGYHEVSISGKEIRKQLEENLAIDERIMRKEVAEILKSEYRKGKNIHWTYSRISNEEREWRNKHKGVVLWFTGLPSSGKSTIAFHLEKKLFILGHSPYVLDGDNIRYGLNKDLTFDSKGRQENIRRIGEVAKLFCDAGFITITAFISPFRMDRRNVRAILKAGEFVEVYIKTHIDICKKRDPKGLYHKALAGKIPEFTGVNSPYEEPMNPEMVINTERYSIEECVGMIYQYLKEHKFIF
ncbi:MAG: adenylyl-sulfate kinase, partial [Patescibacteria group bacterium]